MASDYEVHLTRGQAKAQAKAEADAEAQQIIDRGKPNSLENFQNEFTLKSPTTLPITEPTMCSDSDPSNNCAGPISSHPVTHDTNDTTVPDSQANESPSAEPTAIDSLSDCESFSIPELKPDGIDKKKLISLQQSDTSLSELREKANQHSSNIFYRDSLLMTILTDPGSEHHAIILPKSLRQSVLSLAHNHAGHFGVGTTKSIINHHFTWPGLHSDVSSFIKACTQCQVFSKANPKPAPLKDPEIICERFQKIALDVVGPLDRSKSGFRYIITGWT